MIKKYFVKSLMESSNPNIKKIIKYLFLNFIVVEYILYQIHSKNDKK